VRYRLPKNERRRADAPAVDEIVQANGLSRSQEHALLQLSVCGWGIDELCHLYRVPASVVSEAVRKMERAVRGLRFAGWGVQRLATAFGLDAKEIEELLKPPSCAEEDPWSILPRAERHARNPYLD